MPSLQATIKESSTIGTGTSKISSASGGIFLCSLEISGGYNVLNADTGPSYLRYLAISDSAQDSK